MSEKELKNGIISEEALEKIAGGLKIDKESLKKYAKKAGIAIVSAGAIAAAGYYGGKAAGFWENNGRNVKKLVSDDYEDISSDLRSLFGDQ